MPAIAAAAATEGMSSTLLRPSVGFAHDISTSRSPRAHLVRTSPPSSLPPLLYPPQHSMRAWKLPRRVRCDVLLEMRSRAIRGGGS